jgi:hypothetical protein
VQQRVLGAVQLLELPGDVSTTREY